MQKRWCNKIVVIASWYKNHPVSRRWLASQNPSTVELARTAPRLIDPCSCPPFIICCFVDVLASSCFCLPVFNILPTFSFEALASHLQETSLTCFFVFPIHNGLNGLIKIEDKEQKQFWKDVRIVSFNETRRRTFRSFKKNLWNVLNRSII